MILVTALRTQNRELSLVLSLAACVVLILSGMQLFRTAVDYLEEMRQAADIESTVLSPLIKVCGVGVLTQVCTLFCQEADEDAVGKVVELCGGAAAVCAMLPLLDAVLELIRGLMGG